MAIENTIRITQLLKSKQTKNVYFKTDLIHPNDLVKVDVFEDKIIITKQYLNINQQRFKIQLSTGQIRLTFTYYEDLPIGMFKIDQEESNEDKIVVYFEDKI